MTTSSPPEPLTGVFNQFRYFLSPQGTISRSGSAHLQAGCTLLHRGSEPISIWSAAERSFLKAFLSNHSASISDQVWMGAHYKEGNVTWMDDSGVPYTYNIFGGNTPAGRANEECIVYDQGSSQFIRRKCWLRR